MGSLIGRLTQSVSWRMSREVVIININALKSIALEIILHRVISRRRGTIPEMSGHVQEDPY
jgi:hypothetical protein